MSKAGAGILLGVLALSGCSIPGKPSVSDTPGVSTPSTTAQPTQASSATPDSHGSTSGSSEAGTSDSGASASGASTPSASPTPAPKGAPWTMLEAYAHDASLYTQGLEVRNGLIYESSGRYDASRVVVYPMDELSLAGSQGKLPVYVHSVDLPKTVFGEGLTWGPRGLSVMTWREQYIFYYDETLQPIALAAQDREGWGICWQDTTKRLITSDGSAQLAQHTDFMHPQGPLIEVTEDGTPVTRLNELECVGDTIYANVWQTPDIVAIDAKTGKVTDRWNLASLDPGPGPNEDGRFPQDYGLSHPYPIKDTKPAASVNPDMVLNGIAHIQDDEFLVAGKWWPVMYRVRLTRTSDADTQAQQ